ncbi:cache domain-containing protein, partial [Streptomyces scabiei]
LLVCVVVIGLLFLSITTLTQQYSSLKEEQHTKTKNLVESAHSIITHFYELQQNGELTQQQAKQQALSTIGALRYDNNNY